MNGNVHYWIVCDAVRYIKEYGNKWQKKTLEFFQNSYGKDMPISDIPYYDGIVQKVAGIESLNTDQYCDLAFEFSSLLGGLISQFSNPCKIQGHNMTALSHFMNVAYREPLFWRSLNGYYYYWSSKVDEDADAFTGIVDWFDIEVADKASPQLKRVRPYWSNYVSWIDNFEYDIRYTLFPPVCSLADFYYKRFLFYHSKPLWVGGPNKYISGLQLLGPVFHAIGDVCVPQHVIPALGNSHQAWENYIETKVKNREIDINKNLINTILTQFPFNTWYVYKDTPIRKTCAIEWYIAHIGILCANRILDSVGIKPKQLAEADRTFWKNYMMTTYLEEDAGYMYNLAIAGTVYTILRAYIDVYSLMIGPTFNLDDPEDEDPSYNPDSSHLEPFSYSEIPYEDLPKKDCKDNDYLFSKTRLPYTSTRDFLGIDVDDVYLNEKINCINNIFEVESKEELNSQTILEHLIELEEVLLEKYIELGSSKSPNFNPLNTLINTSTDLKLDAEFGLSTFRKPSLEECNTPELREKYINKLEVHMFKSYLVGQTVFIASLNYHIQKNEDINDTDIKNTKNIISKIKNRRQQAINTKKINGNNEEDMYSKNINIPNKLDIPVPNNVVIESFNTPEG